MPVEEVPLMKIIKPLSWQQMHDEFEAKKVACRLVHGKHDFDEYGAQFPYTIRCSNCGSGRNFGSKDEYEDWMRKYNNGEVCI